MRIAYVVRHIDCAGGRERVLTNKANYLVREFGYEVFIITTLQRQERTIFPLDGRIQVRHLKLQNAEAYPGGRMKYWRYFKSAIESELVIVSPDIAVSMWWGTEWKVLPFVRDGSRKVLEFHSSQYMREAVHRAAMFEFWPKARWMATRFVENRLVSQYDRFVVLTKEDAQSWRHQRVTVIPNALSFVDAMQSRCTSRVVVTAGRLSESKGFDRLIRIWATVERLHPEWTLRVFGDGEERERLSQQITAGGLKNVELRHTTTNLEAEFMEGSIFAFTSRYEGFGMVLLEAMQCGLPVVSYATKSGPSEMIEDRVSGFLVREDDESEFARRLLQLMNDLELRQMMGSAGRQRSRVMFSNERIMGQWRDLFEEMRGSSRSALSI